MKLDHLLLLAQGITWFLLLFFWQRFRAKLDSYDKEKGKNLATKEDIAELTKISEKIKVRLGHSQTVHRIKFEMEFKCSQELWENAFLVRIACMRFLEHGDHDKEPIEQIYLRLLNTNHAYGITILKVRPYIPRDLWTIFNKLLIVVPITDAGVGYIKNSIAVGISKKSLEATWGECDDAYSKRLDEVLVVE